MLENLPHETVLLTGATGLVGSQLLSRLLDRDVSVAVLVRPNRRATAHQRIEQCLAPFEKSRLLPRPRVITADLSASGLGLSLEDREWLGRQSIRVLHCAGSIRFNEDAVSREPFTSNVDGTQNLLRLAGTLDCRAFHFVSTAYVQNGKSSVCREERVAATDQASNDYERSKIIAEQAVDQADGLGPKTIHRPSIVIGDSQTGYTSTFHGFYAPLQVALQMAARYGYDADAGRHLREQLGLTPSDCKNFVPVDWVAECIVRVLIAEMCSAAPSVDTRYLHWTSPAAVPCEVVQQAISEIVAERYGAAPAKERALSNESEFRELLSIYETYFRADPVFDDRISTDASGGLPCPPIDLKLLKKLAAAAANTNFGWPQPRVAALPHKKVVQALRNLPQLNTPPESGAAATLQITLLGPGAPERMMFGESNFRWHRIVGKMHPQRPQCRLTTRLETLADCLDGTTRVTDSMANGLWLTESDDQVLAAENIKKWMSDVQSVGCPK